MHLHIALRALEGQLVFLSSAKGNFTGTLTQGINDWSLEDVENTTFRTDQVIEIVFEQRTTIHI